MIYSYHPCIFVFPFAQVVLDLQISNFIRLVYVLSQEGVNSLDAQITLQYRSLDSLEGITLVAAQGRINLAYTSVPTQPCSLKK